MVVLASEDELSGRVLPTLSGSGKTSELAMFPHLLCACAESLGLRTVT